MSQASTRDAGEGNDDGLSQVCRTGRRLGSRHPYDGVDLRGSPGGDGHGRAGSASSLDVSSRDRTALIMGGTSIPTWSDADVKVIMNQFIAPTHPRETIEPVAVTTPEEGWPITGLIRLIGRALGPRSIFGPGGAGWPDEPWWKLSGLFDLDYEHSIQAGVADLETAMAKYGNDDLVIYGYS